MGRAVEVGRCRGPSQGRATRWRGREREAMLLSRREMSEPQPVTTRRAAPARLGVSEVRRVMEVGVQVQV